MSLIEVDAVEKRYGDMYALKQVSLTLEAGRIGLLGPNGAGKSTLLKCLLGLIIPDGGSVRVLGRDVFEGREWVRARIGYMPEGDSVLPNATALEYTILAAELCGLPNDEAVGRAHQILHDVGLGESRYRKLGSFSTGMKQRARLAQALVGDPKLLLLDEPTSGLDPQGRDEMLALVNEIPSKTGASVILSTHILPDVEKTCDQVVVIAEGTVLYAGGLKPLLNQDKSMYEVRTKGESSSLIKDLEHAQCKVAKRVNGIEVHLPDGKDAKWILEIANRTHTQVRHVAPLIRSLEQAFLETLDRGKHTETPGAN